MQGGVSTLVSTQTCMDEALTKLENHVEAKDSNLIPGALGEMLVW